MSAIDRAARHLRFAANAITSAMRMTGEADRETLLLIAREHLKRAGKAAWRQSAGLLGLGSRGQSSASPACRNKRPRAQLADHRGHPWLCRVKTGQPFCMVVEMKRC